MGDLVRILLFWEYICPRNKAIKYQYCRYEWVLHMNKTKANFTKLLINYGYSSEIANWIWNWYNSSAAKKAATLA
jgi:hypothetical protein